MHSVKGKRRAKTGKRGQLVRIRVASRGRRRGWRPLLPGASPRALGCMDSADTLHDAGDGKPPAGGATLSHSCHFAPQPLPPRRLQLARFCMLPLDFCLRLSVYFFAQLLFAVGPTPFPIFPLCWGFLVSRQIFFGSVSASSCMQAPLARALHFFAFFLLFLVFVIIVCKPPSKSPRRFRLFRVHVRRELPSSSRLTRCFPKRVYSNAQSAESPLSRQSRTSRDLITTITTAAPRW